jgi:hypothetical protein
MASAASTKMASIETWYTSWWCAVDSVADCCADAVEFGKFRADLGMGAFGVVVHGFAKFVCKSAPSLATSTLRRVSRPKHWRSWEVSTGVGKLIFDRRMCGISDCPSS